MVRVLSKLDCVQATIADQLLIDGEDVLVRLEELLGGNGCNCVAVVGVDCVARRQDELSVDVGVPEDGSVSNPCLRLSQAATIAECDYTMCMRRCR